eukprot:EC726840.1.p1 GENE.EC726840.1~~EC726840.1.p1  ORF type:complete len:139 (-),score=36.27 EC726840.1:68-484(-)
MCLITANDTQAAENQLAMSGFGRVQLNGIDAYKPDLVIGSRSAHYIIEIGITNDSNIVIKYEEKLSKYEPFAERLRAASGKSVHRIAVVLGSTGHVHPTSVSSFSEMIDALSDTVSKSAITTLFRQYQVQFCDSFQLG